MKGSHQIADAKDRKKLASFLAKQGQALLPFVGMGVWYENSGAREWAKRAGQGTSY